MVLQSGDQAEIGILLAGFQFPVGPGHVHVGLDKCF